MEINKKINEKIISDAIIEISILLLQLLHFPRKIKYENSGIL
jgi:hypothetical protein